MLRIALTGGIASGKSAVAAILQRCGAVVINADDVARDIVSPGTPVLARIAQEFGDTVISSDGTLDRARLASLVFADDAARRRLEAITHPAIGAEVERRMTGAELADPRAIVVYDVPLLVGSGHEADYAVNVVVTAGEELRIARMVNNRAMDAADARRRIAAQPSDEERVAFADVTIANESTMDNLRSAAQEVWHMAETMRDRLGGEEVTNKTASTFENSSHVVYLDNYALHLARLAKHGVEVVGATRSLPPQIMVHNPEISTLTRLGWIGDVHSARHANPAVGTSLTFVTR